MKFQTIRIRSASGLASTFVRRLPILACFLLAISTKATVPLSDLPDIGPLGNFAVVGSQLNDNQAAISGNVGIFSGGKLKLTKPATTAIDGDVYLATNATFVKMSLFNGTVFSNQDLSVEQNAVVSQSDALSALTPDDTITKIQTAALSFDVPTGQAEVVDLDKGLNLNNQSISLTGGGDLVLNIEGKFNLRGSASIVGGPDNIYINYEGTGTISSKTHVTVDGLVFDPNGAANLDGSWSGGVFGGKKAITLDPGATLAQAPEPGSMVLISTGLVSLLVARRRFCKGLKSHFKEKWATKT